MTSSSTAEVGNARNSRYVDGLFSNLTKGLDKYVLSGSPTSKEQVYNVLEQIEGESKDSDLVQRFVTG
jgi:hypothetical protein